MTSKNSTQNPDQKKPLVLSPFKNTQPLPIQNRFSPITPSKEPSYSSLIKSSVTTSGSSSSLVTKTPTTISPFQQKASSSPLSSKASSYITNPNSQTVKILEEYELQLHARSFQTLTDFLFPKDSPIIGDIRKTREYYQAILIDTGSIKVIHTRKPNSDLIEYSKAHIFHIMTIQEWRARPYTSKTLSNFPQYPSYNYYDYQDAWFNFLYLRSFGHSWFIFFDKNFDPSYSRWFVRWFKYFGNILDTFPTQVKEGFLKFKDIFIQDIPDFEYLLQFSILFKIPWIITWTFTVVPSNGTSPPLLQRTIRVKWWDKLPTEQIENMTVQGVSKYYQMNFGVPAASIAPPPSPLDENEDDQIKQFMAANSKDEIRRLIQEIKQGSPTSSNPDNTQDAQDPYEEFSPFD